MYDITALPTRITAPNASIDPTSQKKNFSLIVCSYGGPAQDSTTLRDDIFLALTAPDDARRPLLLIFTDGIDTTSWLSDDDVLESATSNRDLQELFRRAIRDMRDRYVLTYTPSDVGRPGWHALSVKLTRAHADIVARPGYWVRAHE